MMMSYTKATEEKEWVELLLEAKKMGLSIEEVKEFLAANHSVIEQKILVVS